MSGRSSSPVPPLAVLSEPMNERAHVGNDPKPGKRVPAPEASSDEHSKTSSIWVDVEEEERPRRRRRPRQPTSEFSKSDRPTNKTRQQSSSQLDIGRFLPRLSRLLEATDPNVRQRSYHGNDQKRDVEEKTRSTRYRDENDYVHRHPAKRRTTVIPRRSEPLPNFNPSLLSVLSSLTSASDRSSGSNSTITQQSYDRKRGLPTRRSSTRSGRPATIPESTPRNMSLSKPFNVFDYIEEFPVTEDNDELSVISPASSSSSHYQPSEAGSSEAPTTPSSRSTAPSPTTTRSVSVAELRRKYDADSAVTKMPYSNSRNIESSTRGQRKQHRRKDADEHMGEKGTGSPSTSSSVPEFCSSQRQSSHGSLRALDDEQRLRQQEEDMRRHMAHSQHPYSYEYVPPPESSDLHDTDHALPSQQHQALEHYIHQPMPTRPTPPRIIQPAPSPIANSGSPSVSPPHVPDAPDLTKTTLVGYELLASSLAASHVSSTDSPITTGPTLTPLYRKFSHLHHRVLLHLQDELAELETQLRFLDEGIAQMPASPPLPPTDSPNLEPSPFHPPASRRLERNPNYPTHFARRTWILGEIYNKQKQYHSALRDYTSMLRDSRPAEESEISAYKSFLAERKPIWDGETKFLDRSDDLVVPEPQSQPLTRGTRSGALTAQSALWEQAAFLAALLLLPLLLSTVLPDFVSRAAATALLGAGAGLVIWGGRVRGRE